VAGGSAPRWHVPLDHAVRAQLFPLTEWASSVHRAASAALTKPGAGDPALFGVRGPGPPVPAGLGDLSAGLRAVADFLEIDEDLIAVAAASSPPIQEPEGMADWIAAVPAEEKDTLLARVAAGEGAQVQALLLRRFRAASGSPPAAPARTAAELWRAAGDRKAARARAAEQRRGEAESRRRAAQAAAYAKHLDQLATRTEAAWEKAAELIETRKPRDYDLAASLLRDLQALAERQEDSAAFRKRFLELRAQHQRKPSLLDRFDQAGLPC
jgi:hypothetical protein